MKVTRYQLPREGRETLTVRLVEEYHSVEIVIGDGDLEQRRESTSALEVFAVASFGTGYSGGWWVRSGADTDPVGAKAQAVQALIHEVETHFGAKLEKEGRK